MKLNKGVCERCWKNGLGGAKAASWTALDDMRWEDGQVWCLSTGTINNTIVNRDFLTTCPRILEHSLSIGLKNAK